MQLKTTRLIYEILSIFVRLEQFYISKMEFNVLINSMLNHSFQMILFYNSAHLNRGRNGARYFGGKI